MEAGGGVKGCAADAAQGSELGLTGIYELREG